MADEATETPAERIDTIHPDDASIGQALSGKIIAIAEPLTPRGMLLRSLQGAVKRRESAGREIGNHEREIERLQDVETTMSKQAGQLMEAIRAVDEANDWDSDTDAIPREDEK